MNENKPIIYVYPDCILFIGKLPENDWHAIPVETAAFNLTNLFRVKTDLKNSFKSKSIYYPSNVVRQTKYGKNDVLAFMIFPKYLPLSTHFQQRFLNAVVYGKELIKTEMLNELQWFDILKNAYNNRVTGSELKRDFNSFFCVDNDGLFQVQENLLSKQVENVINYIKKSALNNEAIDLEKDLDMQYSLQHIRRLFKAQVGTSIKKYYTHQRMIQKLLGNSLDLNTTEAAVYASYYDLSHACKSHKQSYGIPIDATWNADIRIDEFSM